MRNFQIINFFAQPRAIFARLFQRRMWQNGHKFFSTVAGDDFAGALCCQRDGLGHHAEASIPFQMPVAIIECLEVVDIDQRQAQNLTLSLMA